MKVSEIISKTLEWTHGLNLGAPVEPTNSSEYANTPHAVSQPVATILAQGDDINKPKNPSDIRADSVSMYPNFQAKG